MEFISNSAEDTILFASEFAKKLKAGDVILLDGDLGAGKTVFTKGIVLALSDGKEIAVSPTFVIVNEYRTSPPIYHFDFYRIESVDELYGIGIEEYLFGDGICIIEWPERAPEVLPKNSTSVKILKLDENRRKIIIEESGNE